VTDALAMTVCRNQSTVDQIICQLPATTGTLEAMKSVRGFTLVELMVVVAIVAILVGMAVPSFKSMIQSSAMSSIVNTFLADTRLARSEAIKRSLHVVMCRSNAPEATTLTCSSGAGASGNGWVSGWIVFVDDNGDNGYDSGELVLKVQPALSTVNSIVSNHGYTHIFLPNGRLNLSSASTIQFGSDPPFTNEQQRIVCISNGGRARVAGDGNAACAGD